MVRSFVPVHHFHGHAILTHKTPTRLHELSLTTFSVIDMQRVCHHYTRYFNFRTFKNMAKLAGLQQLLPDDRESATKVVRW